MVNRSLNGDQFPPPPPGSTPIPEGTIRFTHYTSPEHVGSILEQGLTRKSAEESYARGGTESPEVFATAGALKPDQQISRPHIEGYAHPHQLNVGRPMGRDPQFSPEDVERMHGYGSTITFHGDVPPEQITAVHEPWHSHARYLVEEGPESGWIGGDFKNEMTGDPDTDKALTEVRKHYGRS